MESVCIDYVLSWYDAMDIVKESCACQDIGPAIWRPKVDTIRAEGACGWISPTKTTLASRWFCQILIVNRTTFIMPSVVFSW